MKFNNTYLMNKFKDQSEELSRIRDSWSMTDGEFCSKLDSWFDNFKVIDYDLAYKLIKNIRYFTKKDYVEELSRIYRQINRRIQELCLKESDIVLLVPDGYGDSAHKHSYDLTKIWKIRTDQIVAIQDLKNKTFPENSVLIAFNDTYGSGKQFIEQMIGDNELEAILRNNTLFIVGITISKLARKYLSHSLPYATIVPDTNPITIFDTFSYEEFLRIESIGNDVYPPHPLGYGKTGLLVAYDDQCPNNTLPLIWANSESKNNFFEGRAYQWTPLFEYKPKIVTKNKENAHETESLKPFKNKTKLNFNNEELKTINDVFLDWRCSRQTHGKILNRLTKWFDNFEPKDKSLALSIFGKINYLSLDKTRDLIRELRDKVMQETARQGDKKEDIILVLTGDGIESHYHYVYDFMRIWGLRMSQILTIEHLYKHPYESTGKHLVYFYHSRIHKQETFISDIWGKAKCLPAKFHHIVSFMLSEPAKNEFDKLPGAEKGGKFKYYYSELASKNIGVLLNADEMDLLEALLKSKNIRTVGLKDKFLTVYYFKCLKDVLSLLWYDRKISPLFESK